MNQALKTALEDGLLNVERQNTELLLTDNFFILLKDDLFTQERDSKCKEKRKTSIHAAKEEQS